MKSIKNFKRIIIKIGTNVLAPSGIPDPRRIHSLASDIATLQAKKLTPILVSSGAIGFGARTLGMETRPSKVDLRQACASVGQPVLMRHWQDALSTHGIIASQILLTREHFDNRHSYLNLRNVVESLLALKVVPIMNENDSVSTTEIGDIFGDNDSLSAHVASKLGAELLVILTDIDALYDKDPRKFSDAEPIRRVHTLTKTLREAAGSAGSEHATGGMVTKLAAVEIASRAGCQTVLADGRIPGNLARIVEGEEVGTLFQAGPKPGARNRWILGARTKGNIYVDSGAIKALENRNSLLPTGITAVDGTFDIGDVVYINTQYKAVTSMGSQEIQHTMGRHSRDIRNILGPERREEVARAEDIVSLSSNSSE